MKEGNKNMSGLLPNTSVSSMSGKLPFEQKEQEQPRMNGNYQMSGKMENTGGPRPSMEPDISKVRRYMSQRIYECIMRRKRNPHEAPQKKMFELVNKLEECLFKIYGATDEYMNLATLESRIHGMLRPSSLGSHNLHHSHVNSSSLIGKMIPTPGMPQNGSSAMTTSVDNSMVVSSSNPRESSVVTSLPLINRPADEAFSNGYQHLPSSFSTGAIRNMGMRVERVPAQMIPTPGLSSATSDRMKDTSNSLSCTSSNVNSFLNADSLILSQPVLQKPLAGEHNSHILQDPESRVADKISPSLPQTSYGVSNETVNARVGMIGNNIKLLKGTGVIEGQPLTTMHGACPEKLDQRQRPLLQGDSYGVSTGDDSESLNLYFPGTSVNAVPFQSMRKTDSSMLPNQSNILTALPAKKLKQNHFRGQVKFEPGLEHHNEVQPTQASVRRQFSDVPSQCTQNSVGIVSESIHSLSIPSAPQGSLPLQNQTSRHLQHMEHPQPSFFRELFREFSNLSCGLKSDVKMQSQWSSQKFKDGSQRHHQFPLSQKSHQMDTSCPVCVPVKNYIAFQLKAYSRSGSRLPPPNSVGVDDDSVHLEPPLKRLKFVQNSLCTTSDTSTNREATHKSREPHVLQETRPVKGSFAISMPVKHGSTDVDEGSREITEVDQLKTDDYCINRPDIEANMLHNPAAQENIKVEAGVNELKHDNISMPTGNASATMSEKPKMKGVSLTEAIHYKAGISVPIALHRNLKSGERILTHTDAVAWAKRAKVTAARLPYFDGDYFPGAAEEMICQLQQEEEVRKQCKKGAIKKSITKRALKGAKGSGQTDLSGDVSEDLLLMRKLGETICAMKEDFIMVHLQHACSHCCILMVSGNRWVCNICENFQLCDTCYEAEQKLEDRDRHPINQKDEHTLRPVAINDVPEDTKDEDEILETGQGWRCETCPDYDVCNACYSKYCGINHPHKLTNHPSMADRDAQNKEARQLRVTQLKKMLELLVHASRCHFLLCEFPDCHKVKGLFRHGMQCKLRASGGCPLCKRMWHLLQLHARACKESECDVPRCRDLKGHLMRLQQQSDSRRRAAVVEMMRQRAAEVGGNRKSR
ncbi:hypothetical protein Leryth_006238 [Lithospermum erythrorhizon]|nr:hypothetical protein Leryth_006238 [Lithospermum erythrorhizon]